MNNYLYSEGTMKTTINNQVIDDKSYKFEYDGDIGKGVVQNNKDSYYVELDDNDFEKIFKKNPDGNSQNIERKLKNLLNKSKSTKNKIEKKKSTKSTKRTKSTKSTKRTKSTTRKSMKPSIKSTSFQERNNSKSTTQSPKKSTRKSTKKSTRKSTRKSNRSLKKTNKMPLETNFLKTLI